MNKDFSLISEMLDIIGITCKNEEDLLSLTIDMDTLKNNNNIQHIYTLIPKFKLKYNTSFFTCLHENSIDKQKLPAVNFIRQILKCNGYKLKGYNVSDGYNKHTGKKLYKRRYSIVPLLDLYETIQEVNDN